MIDPVIFSFELFGITIALRWYGVLVMLGVIVAAWIAERDYSRRGENGDRIWDALIWVLPAGIIGALPVFVTGAIYFTTPDYIGLLFTTSAGCAKA